ncbi:MAG: NAD-dependent epimerase/dehydratase family protein [Scytonematopsis contorta HA4267-MV1]|jgi:UDP-glucose 4-epimerase|nr:NAD-dependent epimerase/dehydratase family protein [Scytonematopsis contorta HA4267-MV1]
MNHSKCLVLGGFGFLGMHLCESLARENHSVVSFGRKPNFYINSATNIEWFAGDFHNPNDLYKAIKGCSIVYHLISSTTPAKSNINPIQDIQSNVEGTLKLLEIALAEGVQKVIFVSSGGTVYGKPQSLPIIEDAPTNPICSYGISKLTIEKYLHMHHVLHGLGYCILRVANLFGERQPLKKGQGAVGVFMEKALRGEAVEIWGDGEVVRDYVYVKDVADALVSSMYYDGEQKLFNIGSGVGRSLNQLLFSLEAVMNCSIKKNYKPGRPVDVPINVLDISLAKKYLGWHPKTDWVTALDQTYQWMLTNMSYSSISNTYQKP